MKTGKHITAVIFTVLVIFLLPVQVLAAGKVDPDREISLTIRNRYGEEGISGVTFDLFLVSAMDQNGELQPTEDFEVYAEELDIRGVNDELWIQMAYTLEEDILSGMLGEIKPADSLMTGQEGSVSFPSGNQALVPGLYLVLGTHIEKDNYVYSTSPFFVCLPNRDAETDQWDYTVEANAKPDRKPVIGNLSVVKVWEDDCHKSQRPASISVQLVCDGQNYGDPVTLPYNGQ